MTHHTCCKFIMDGGEQALIEAVKQVQGDGSKSLLILSCADNQLDLSVLDTFLRQLSIPVFGGIFPQVIHDRLNHTAGSLVVGLDQKVEITVIEKLSSLEADLSVQMEKLDINSQLSESYLILLDGLAERLNKLTDLLYERLGADATIAGGGAGSLDFVQRPCLFSNSGLLMDAALLINLEKSIAVGVQHGWQQLSGPYLVTQSSGNQIQSLNFQPAFDVYRDAIAPHTKRLIDIDNFFSIAKQFPFGMEQLGQEFLVRDPISTDGSTLNCVGHVPEQTMLYLLQGRQETLIDAAGKAAGKAFSGLIEKKEPGKAILFDCISRVLFLEEQFKEEIEQIAAATGGAELIGVLTLGEVSSLSNGGIHFHNKTTVVASLGVSE